MRIVAYGLLALAAFGCSSNYRVTGQQVLAPHTSVVRARSGARHYVHFSFEFSSLTQPYVVCESAEYGVLLRVTKADAFGRAWFWVPVPAASSVDQDTGLQSQLRRAMSKCRMDAFFGYAVRYLPTSLLTEMRAVPLLPGMRVRLERAGGVVPPTTAAHAAADAVADSAADAAAQKIQPFLGVGTTIVTVVGDETGVSFDAFSRVANVTPSGDLSGVIPASAPLDLNRPALQPTSFPYWRALFPGVLTSASSTVTPRVSQQVIFVGATSAELIESLFIEGKSFEKELANLCKLASARCVVFPWHTYVIPEIPVTIRGQSTFVSQGTTLGDVATRGLNWSRSDDRALGYSELNSYFDGRLQLYRQFGVRLVPVELPFDEIGSWTRIPLAQGDHVLW